MCKCCAESDNESGDESSNSNRGCDGDVDQKGRHPPSLDIAVSHNERGVVIQPGISLYGTALTTVTPARLNVSLCVSTVSDKFSRTPGLDRITLHDRSINA